MFCKCGCGNEITSGEYCIDHDPRLNTNTYRDNYRKGSLKRWGHPLDRFKSRIGKPDENGCMNWQGTIEEGGYGVIKWFGKILKAHRIAYEQFIGVIPDGMFVLHKCDNRRCVNPEHLFVGNNQDNIKDSVEKGRWGSDGRFKLNESQVKEILHRIDVGVSERKLASQFNISRRSIQRIKNGELWKHITSNIQ